MSVKVKAWSRILGFFFLFFLGSEHVCWVCTCNLNLHLSIVKFMQFYPHEDKCREGSSTAEDEPTVSVSPQTVHCSVY